MENTNASYVGNALTFKGHRGYAVLLKADENRHPLSEEHVIMSFDESGSEGLDFYCEPWEIEFDRS